MSEWDNLPELNEKERRALDAVDMTPILGTMEERWRLAMDVAVRFLRERNNAREAARALYRNAYGQSLYTTLEQFVEEHPWLEQEK